MSHAAAQVRASLLQVVTIIIWNSPAVEIVGVGPTTADEFKMATNLLGDFRIAWR